MTEPVNREVERAAEADLCRALAAATGRESTDADVVSSARLFMPLIRSLLPVPVSELAEAYVRNKRIRDEYARRRPQAELAADYALDARQVRRIVRGVRRHSSGRADQPSRSPTPLLLRCHHLHHRVGAARLPVLSGLHGSLTSSRCSLPAVDDALRGPRFVTASHR